MGRGVLDTVDFFPLYTVPSRTLQMLERKYGNDGFIVYYKLLQLLAAEDGHFYDARKKVDFDFLVSKLCAEESIVRSILDDLSEWGKIDKELWGVSVIWYQGFVDTLKDVYRNRRRETPTIENVYERLKLGEIISTCSLHVGYNKSGNFSEKSVDFTKETGMESNAGNRFLHVETTPQPPFLHVEIPVNGIPTCRNRQRRGEERRKKKQQADKKKGAVVASAPAAALSDSFVFSKEVLDKIDAICAIRAESQPRKVKSPFGLKAALKAAYKLDPNEATEWESEINIHNENRRRKEEAMNKKAQINKKIEHEKNDAKKRRDSIDAVISAFNALPYETKVSVRQEAKKLAGGGNIDVPDVFLAPYIGEIIGVGYFGEKTS